MRGTHRILTANLGSQTVSLAEFRAQSGGRLMLSRYKRRDILAANPADPMRQEQITGALREMLSELGIKHGRINYAVPAQATFMRFVKLPPVEEEKIERIIAFEAQQNVPFPIEEVVWDYQLVGGGGDQQLQVVLVAIKADLLETMNSAVEAAGLRPSIVGVATMGLYNSFRFNYSEVTEPSLIIDIGARTTNLVFMEPGKVFSRSVPLGGSAITGAIAKEFHESLSLAESRKRDSGFVSVGGASPETPDPDVARMSKIIRSTMTRLHAEVMRSISHYRSQQQGNAPERIYLSGGTSSTRNIREFFQEKLQVPIEVLDAVRRIPIAPDAEAAEITGSAHLLGELVGLALRAVCSCPIELNLRPPSVVRSHELERRRPLFLSAAACLFLAAIGWSVYYFQGAALLRESKQQVDNKVAGLRGFETQLDAVRKQASTLDLSAAPLVAAVEARSFWPRLLEDLNARLPKEKIWITDLIPLSNGNPITPDNVQLSTGNPAEATATPTPRSTRPGGNASAIDGLIIRGLYMWNPRQQEVVVDYFKNLVQSPFLKIDKNNQAGAIKPTMPNNMDWAFPYELRVDLKQPLPLP